MSALDIFTRSGRAARAQRHALQREQQRIDAARHQVTAIFWQAHDLLMNLKEARNDLLSEVYAKTGVLHVWAQAPRYWDDCWRYDVWVELDEALSAADVHLDAGRHNLPRNDFDVTDGHLLLCAELANALQTALAELAAVVADEQAARRKRDEQASVRRLVADSEARGRTGALADRLLDS